MKHTTGNSVLFGFTTLALSTFVSLPLVSESMEPQGLEPPSRRVSDLESQEVPSLSLPFTTDLEQSDVPKPIAPTPAPPLDSDMKADPLFLEIQKMIQDGNKKGLHSIRPEVATDAYVSENQAVSFSSHRWNAVESMLQAARLLDRDAAAQLEASDLAQASKSKEMSKRLRLQCLDLLER